MLSTMDGEESERSREMNVLHYVLQCKCAIDRHQTQDHKQFKGYTNTSY